MARRTTNSPSAAVQTRLDRCRRLMSASGINAYLITNRPDQIYLTGFDGEDGAAMITSKDVHIITDGRFAQTVNMQAPWARYSLRKNGLIAELADVFRKRRVKNIAVQGDVVPIEQLSALRKACKGVKFASAPEVVNKLRLTKDRTEIGKIRRAIEVAESAFKALRRQIRIGMTEADIAALLEYEMKKRGARSPSFPTIVAEGRNAALPHAVPGKRVLKKGSLLLLDWGAQVDYYCSDLTRMLFIGKIPPRFKAVYNTVLEAQKKAIAAVAPGKRMCDIDAVARDHIAAGGYGDKFGHGLGHGIGLDIHELPRVRPKIQNLLEPGMVITIEPGVYLPGSGGVRVEDDVLVTSRGHEVLTKLSTSLAKAVI